MVQLWQHIRRPGTGLPLLLAGLFGFCAFAAQPPRKASDERIYLVHADSVMFNQYEMPDAQRLSGKVHLRHAGMNMYADSVVFFQAANNLEAFGHVRVVQGDTLSLRGDYLYYNGDSQIAEMRHNVVLRHRNQTLNTDSLNYDRLYSVGYFFDGGELIDGDNHLTADWGEYYTSERKATFNFNVRLDNPKFRLVSDTLHYDVRTKWADVQGPSNIYHADDVVYTERGFYNSELGIYRLSGRGRRADLYHNAVVEQGLIKNFESRLSGDSLVYEKDSLMRAFGNAVYEDRKNKGMLTGDYGEYAETRGEAMATGHALAREYSNGADTLYVHADTLRLFTYDLRTDSLKTAEVSDSLYRVLHGYFHCRAYRSDVQAVCDSMVYNSKRHVLTLHKDPIVWSDTRQVLGEEINVFTNDSTIDSIHVDRQALLVEEVLTDSLTAYNQIAGQQMRSYFDHGEIVRNEVEGNVCIVYYPLEKDSTITNVTYAETAKMRMTMKERRMQRIWAAPAPVGTFYPVGRAPADKVTLPNFAWFDYIRPTGKDDVFNWRGKKQGTELKVTPRRQAPLQYLTP